MHIKIPDELYALYHKDAERLGFSVENEWF